MSKYVTVKKLNKDKIHYVEFINGQPDTMTECGVTGPFELVNLIYKDRYEGRVCKKCFKEYISSLSKKPIEEE